MENIGDKSTKEKSFNRILCRGESIQTIHSLFEEQVNKTPHKIAIIFQNQSMTYQELNERANQLACYLRKQGVQSESLVAICTQRCCEMIIGMLGILKAGGAYVPIDPNYPIKRIENILQDIGAKVLLTQQHLVKHLPKNVDYLDIDNPDISKEPISNLKNLTNEKNLIYVMYTSGSTGRPKGTKISHEAVKRLVVSPNYVQISEKDRIPQLSNISFDAATFEIWATLLNGAELHLLDDDIILDIRSLCKMFLAHQYTIIFLTTALFNQIVKAYPKSLCHFSTILFGGETANPRIIRDLLSYWQTRGNDKSRLIHVYGPTECTTFATFYPIIELPKTYQTVPIGKPINDTEVYVLNDRLELVKTGEIGELYLGGKGIAYGYFNQPDLTQEKFTTNPFGTGRIYKTGDLVRWLVDGNLDFIGRLDDQVKIHGFRIEPEEINYYLQSHEGISQSLVLVKKNNLDSKYLVAYLVFKNIEFQRNFNCKKLYDHLARYLPEYMKPTMYFILEQFPLTSNGKIDRAKLLQLDESQAIRPTSYMVPTSLLERQLIIIWSETLNIPVNQIGINDNFFTLGGHSLLAVQILLRIHIGFSIHIEIHHLFEYPTIHELAKFIGTIKSDVSTSHDFSIQPIEQTSDIPLSHAQELIWRHQQTAPHVPFYNEPLILSIPMDLNRKLLEKSLRQLIERHAILRTNYYVKREQVFQRISPLQSLAIPFYDLRDVAPHKRSIKVIEYATKEARKLFQLDSDLLIRFLLMQLDDAEYRLVIVAHHLIIDAVSMFQVFLKELEKTYVGLMRNEIKSFTPLPFQYVDYAVWHRKFLDKNAKIKNYKQHLIYWKDYLHNLPRLQWPQQKFIQQANIYQGERICVEFSNALTKQIKSIARKESVTVFTVLVTAFIVLLYRYTQQTDIAIGTVISARYLPELDDLMGNFLNTIILRTKFDSQFSYKELLHVLWENLKKTYAHQDIPFQELLPSVRKQSKQLFPIQVSFVYEPGMYHSKLGWSLDQLQVHTKTSKFDLTFELDERDGHFIGRVEYNIDLFADWFIKRLIDHYKIILEAMTIDMQQSVAALSLIDQKGKQKILFEWNQARTTLPLNKTLHELFEEQAKKTPNQVAIIFEDQTLTYNELNIYANQLAYYLRDQGVVADTLVPICMERGVEMVIAMLGVLKAGGAYVPIDPAFPQDRIETVLRDCQAKILLVQHPIPIVFKEIKVINLAQYASFLIKEKHDNLAIITKPDHLAYVLYTSGSTGQPKGICINHAALVNHMSWMIDQKFLSSQESVLQRTSFTFDASVWEFYLPLLIGARLVLAPNKINENPEQLLMTIQKYNIQVIQFVPSLLQIFLETNHVKGCISLKHVFSGGEILSTKIIDDFYRCFPLARLHNLYGPTETTIDATIFHCIPGETYLRAPIGRPIDNVFVYVLDSYQKPVPVGIVGELYIGGITLARGYLNNSELTQEKFIHNPFGEGRLYKTGDLVRWLPDGNLEFIGRIDNQIKIRGFRVECGEIEANLLKHPDIQQSAVVVKEKGMNKKIIAYFVSSKTIDSEELCHFLKRQLPDYMIPNAFVKLDQLPLTSHGKMDKHTLSQLDAETVETKHVAPRNEIEKTLCALWSELLSIQDIGIHDNFFSLGGHSLLAMQLVSRIQKIFGVLLGMSTIFETQTIAVLGQLVQKKQKVSMQAEELETYF